ncbi:MAG TPA: ATP-grasp domain-containing protein [Myxococcota bacterium]|nr:ATP-grasp domain-containing protein [Myxococcota bacterium]
MSLQLVLVSHRAVSDHPDLERIARSIERDAPDLRVRVLRDKRSWLSLARAAWRPTLVFSAKALRKLRPLRGSVLQGSQQSKIEEMEELERAGIPVPRWRPVIREAAPPDVGEFGPYVVMKPDRGGCGADVRIVRSAKVRFLDASTRRAARAERWIAQQYVHTGPWPTAQRVLTLCGTPLYAIRTRADRSRAPIRNAGDFGGGGKNIVASAIGCSIEFCDDADVLEMAERAARVFPEIPALGVDILRDVESGALHVIEVNSRGGSWGFSSRKVAAMQQVLGRPFESQFDAFARAARVLTEQTRRLAR